MKDFKDFKFRPDVAAGIETAGYTKPTPIQAAAIPTVMKGHDVMGLAQTGTGKTAAFGLPILNRLSEGRRGQVRALIIAPTRELAEQIHGSIETLATKTGLKSITVYGGVNINPQINKLKRGADIVVACPGRLLDHIGQETINLRKLEVLVLDEADHMFDMGFFARHQADTEAHTREPPDAPVFSHHAIGDKKAGPRCAPRPGDYTGGQYDSSRHRYPRTLPGSAAPEDKTADGTATPYRHRICTGFHPHKAPGKKTGRTAKKSGLYSRITAGEPLPEQAAGCVGWFS